MINIRIAGIHKTSLVDNIGVNYTIFLQGCSHDPKCPQCHNPSTHDPQDGYEITLDELKVDISSNQLISGVTFSGGEPLDQFLEVYELAKWCKEQGLSTTLYTGYIVEFYDGYTYISTGNDFGVEFHNQVFDYIIDGPFELDKKTLDLPFVGSSNQRILIKGVDY